MTIKEFCEKMWDKCTFDLTPSTINVYPLCLEDFNWIVVLLGGERVQSMPYGGVIRKHFDNAIDNDVNIIVEYEIVKGE